MAAQYNTVSVGSTATVILPANLARRGCLVTNTSAGTVYLGFDANVTTANGIPIVQNAFFNNSGENIAWRGVIYGIVSSGTSDCRFMEWEN